MNTMPKIISIDVVYQEGTYHSVTVGIDGVKEIKDTGINDSEAGFYTEYTAFGDDGKPICRIGGNNNPILVFYERG